MVGEEGQMNGTVRKAIGIVLLCVALHFGVQAGGGILPLIVFGCGLGFLLLP